MPTQQSRPIVRFALLTLAANIFVIAWGAWVRASGSGAGCGNHWPTCNGTVIPQSPTLHTIVEFTHRVSSAIALFMILALCVASWRVFPRGHLARRTSVIAMVLIVVEALIGAGLVKFNLVAENASLERAFTLGVHLVNTQFLLAAIALTAWWADGRPPPSPRSLGARAWWLVPALVGLALVAMSGAIASLGDTLFPARTLSEAFAQDRNPAAHVLLRLRVWHPALAIVTGVAVVAIASAVMRWRDDRATHAAARAAIAFVFVQWGVGITSLALLVPVALQLLHLVTADLLWLSVVWMSAAALAVHDPRTTPATSLAASASKMRPAPSSR